jgi:hypothetical protein
MLLTAPAGAYTEIDELIAAMADTTLMKENVNCMDAEVQRSDSDLLRRITEAYGEPCAQRFCELRQRLGGSKSDAEMIDQAFAETHTQLDPHRLGALRFRSP